MEISDAEAFLSERHKAVIITVGQDDVPHATNVVYAYDGSMFRVSVTDGRVKTDNLRRRPLAVMHVASDDFWSYAAVTCDVELSPVSATAGDAVGQELLALHETVSDKPHPDPDEFLQAMVDDHRLVLRLTPTDIHGQIPA